MPMSPRLLRPIASGVHPEAAAWRSAVVANGGSVSASTMKAVNTFCAAIDAAGIRDRFYRLNLFCGDNLNAALVPLYRGPTFGGTTYGYVTDTNNNFVSGDYSENTGLIGNGTNKGLATGLVRSAISGDASVHSGVFVHTSGTGTFRTYVGYALNAGAFRTQQVQARNPATVAMSIANDAVSLGETATAAYSDGDLLIGCISGVGAGLNRLYRNGSSVSTGVGRDTSGDTIEYGVFSLYRSHVAQLANHSNGRLGGYTLGLNLTDAESAAYAAIWDTFLKALGRR